MLFTTDWATAEVVLCAKSEDSRVVNPLCNWLFKDPNPPVRTGDWAHVCDPAVVRVDGQYWMYYTAEAQALNENGEPLNGDNQMFLARSSDGRNWTKYPNNSVAAQPVLPFPDPALYEFQHGKYGTGEGSAIYKDNQFWLYYTYWPYNGGEGNSVYLTKSSDGINLPRGEKIFAESTMPFLGQGAGGGIDVKYIPGWNVFIYVAPTASKQDLTWNISRDGQHWLPWDPTKAFGHHWRVIPLPRRFAISPALEGNEHGHIGDGALASTQSTSVVFAAGDAETVDGFYLWTLDGVDLTLTPQPLTGVLDSVDTYNIARGWAYDPDTGTNDAAANGGPSAPLGHDTWVRAVATNATTGQVYEGQWQSAQVTRNDLVVNSAAPDPYHGFVIDLKAQGFPPGTYSVHVQGGEFPTGMGATNLAGVFTVSIAAPCTAPAISSHTSSTTITSGSTIQLTATASGSSPLSYQWYVGTASNVSTPLAPGATVNVTPSATTDYWLRVTNSCGQVDSQTVRITVSSAPPAASLYTITPCRVLDTRDSTPIAAGAARTVQLTGLCTVPTAARAAAINVTSVLPAGSGHLTLYPADIARPNTIVTAYRIGRTRATSAIIRLSPSGSLTLYNNGTSAVDVIIDVTSYFR